MGVFLDFKRFYGIILIVKNMISERDFLEKYAYI